MKKITFLLAVTIFFISAKTKAQDDANRECIVKYNLFKGDYQSKKYDDAYTHWIYLMDNCKDLSVNIYKLGSNLAENVKKDPALVKRVFDQRLQYFPDVDPAKVHSDYAEYLLENKLGTDDEVFSLLDKAYKLDPTRMGVKNLYIYFQGVTDRNKDTNPQLVFDTYDDVVESVGEKLEGYAKKILELSDSTRVLDKREASNLNAYKTNSKALGQIEGGLDNMISELATCERLIPLYRRDFDENRGNVTWLKRAVSRMFYKECQDDPLYAELAKAYAEASPSPEAYAFLANVLENNGDSKGATEMRQKSFDLETDPLKKANYKLKFAQAAQSRGQLSNARSLAREALKYNPNSGKAYLLIGRLYASSANNCGDDEFEKRMVYAAALRQAQKAASVDPSIYSLASRYIASYKGSLPTKKVIFIASKTIGQSHTIKCWVGETVTIASSD
jgi:tetratricopeptide (TPR) repeat protein